MIEFIINVSTESIEMNDFPFCGGHKSPKSESITSFFHAIISLNN